MTVITSPRNPMIKQIRALRRRAERGRRGLFFAEGLHVVRAAIEAGVELESLIVAPSLLSAPSVWATIARFKASGGCVIEVSSEVLRSLSSREEPQGIAIVGRQRWAGLPSQPDAAAPWVALHGVQQPGNLGAVLRTCDAAGAGGLILLGPTTDPYDPAALRASMGTLLSQRLIRTDVDAFVAWTRSQRMHLIGTSGEGGRDYRAVHYHPPVVLLIGAERQGLPPALLDRCDAVAHIPMAGRADSLNMAVATGVMLYEAIRHGRAPEPVQR